MAFKTARKIRIWSKEHRTKLCFSQILLPPFTISSFSFFSPPSTYVYSFLPNCSVGSDSSKTPLKLSISYLPHGTVLALTRNCFLLQLCFSFTYSTRHSYKSPIWKLLYFLFSLPRNIIFFPKLCSFLTILSGLHLITGQGLPAPAPQSLP